MKQPSEEEVKENDGEEMECRGREMRRERRMNDDEDEDEKNVRKIYSRGEETRGKRWNKQ